MSTCETVSAQLLSMTAVFSMWRNANGRYTLVRLGMSKHQSMVDENHSQE